MYQHNLGYRFETSGGVEGFTGTAFGRDAAKRDAVRKAKAKCEAIGEPFSESKIISSRTQVTDMEMSQLREDWKISARSRTT